MNNHSPMFRPYQKEDQPALIDYVLKLYEEDPEGETMKVSKIEKTIQRLEMFPMMGQIIIIEKASKVIGYAFLINYWSNEYGGNIIFIDELFVDEKYRNQRIGADFVKKVIAQEFGPAVLCSLEVMPSNERALNFYLKLGFQPYRNQHLICTIT